MDVLRGRRDLFSGCGVNGRKDVEDGDNVSEGKPDRSVCEESAGADSFMCIH